MTAPELILLETQLGVLREIQQRYAGHTIGNIIQQMEARVKYYERQNSTRQ